MFKTKQSKESKWFFTQSDCLFDETTKFMAVAGQCRFV